MKTTGESSIPKFLFLVFLGHPNVHPAYDEKYVQLKKHGQATMSDQHEKLDNS